MSRGVLRPARAARAALAGLAVLGALGWCRHAGACSIATLLPRVVSPADGAVDVPTNPWIWIDTETVSEPGVDTFVVRGPDGTEVATELVTFSSFDMLMRLVIPTEELDANTRYEVMSCPLDCDRTLRSFTTGAGPDTEPPAPPEELGRESGFDREIGLCADGGGWVKVDVLFEGVLLIDVGLPEFDERSLSGSPDWFTADGDAPIEFGGDAGISMVGDGRVRLGSFDQAGNFSGWTEIDEVEIPGCGCSPMPRGGSVAWAWPLGVLLVRRARRRPRSRTTDAGRLARAHSSVAPPESMGLGGSVVAGFARDGSSSTRGLHDDPAAGRASIV